MWTMPRLDIVTGIIDKVAGHVDKFTLDKQEKAQLIAEINKAQMEVNKVEAGHTSMFVAGWRPFTGWICASALAYHYILQPLLTFILYSFGNEVVLPTFDMGTLTTVLLGMLGLGGMRSFEKVQRSA
tara:strand:- start:4451 stop:4831 length:381 start_codon:yes stop_codon:yes gene_type:complete